VRLGWSGVRAAAFSPDTTPHRTHDLRSGCQDSVQKTICCNSTSNAPDDGCMYPKHVELSLYE